MIDVLLSRIGSVTGTARAVGALTRSGVVRPVRPDRLAGMACGLVRYGIGVAAGYTAGAARHPGRTAIVDDAGALSYGEVHWRSDRLARALLARGTGPDEPIALLCRNSRHPVEAAAAAEKVGADVVLLNNGMAPTQIAEVLADLGVHTVVVDADLHGRLADVAEEVGIVVARGHLDGHPTCEDLIASAPADGRLPVRPERSRTVVLTSGTTGVPKGARRPHPSTLAPAASILSEIPLRAGVPVHIAAPLFHTWGNAGLLLAVLHGSTVVLRSRFDPADLLDTVAAHRCDTVFAVPVMVQRVVESGAPGWRAGSSPRIVAVSGSALPAGLAAEFMDRFGDVLYNLYGSTEVSWVSIAGPADLRAAPGTAGRAPVGTTLRILDDDGHPVPPGVEGRVFVGNDMPFEGYTRGDAVEMHGGLLGTGDIGILDENGLLHLTGRADDMIVSGGENVHPGPVEDLIAARDEVRDVAVVGVPDDEFGQRLAAYVVAAPGASIDADALRDAVRSSLSRFAVPRDVVVLDALPRNQMGKVARRDLPPPT
ncbi:MAG: long-chain-fatty-acid--CoA ligase FadD2 [Pseudonocardia sp.]|uniref:AMP-binding protein n=1 Tax=unclassified Pseudonocardia TaxID=2619320 RepID=UPI001AC686ED|nr:MULTISPECIES: AMP-binding protein [unclassified Pseudonocardia]MBN9108288.1 long-chain-fatty-acid--CoA ligase FadD2 [Pseudonocardia sp.]